MNQKVKEFFDQFVDIEELEDKSEGKFGHYPFQGQAEKDGKLQVFALCGLQTEQVFGVISRMISEGNEKVLFSVDFPNGGDIHTDFVGIFSYLENKLEVDLFPYENTTGKQLDPIKSGTTYDFVCNGIERYTGKKVHHGG